MKCRAFTPGVLTGPSTSLTSYFWFSRLHSLLYSFTSSLPWEFQVLRGAEQVNLLCKSKYWSFSISPSNEYSGLISFRTDWLDHLAIHPHKSLLHHHSSKASILWHSAFFIVQLSHPYMTTGKAITLTRRTFVDKVSGNTKNLPMEQNPSLEVTSMMNGIFLLYNYVVHDWSSSACMQGETLGWWRLKIARRNINNFRYTGDTTLTAESKEELKSLLLKGKEESEKVGLKLNIQKTKFMASGPITSWQIDGEPLETVTDFIFLGSKLHFPFSLSCIGEGNGNPLQCSCLENPRDGGARWATVYGVAQSRTRLKWLSSSSSKLTADGDCSHEIKRLLGRKLWPT